MANHNRSISTLEDVAKRAGVSTASVSRFLNSPEQLSEKTRERILLAVNELGYSPNFNARALAAKKSNTVGAIIPTMENAIFARGIQAFQEELASLGYTLLIASSSYQQDIEEQQLRNIVARGADGLLLIGQQREQKLYDFLKKHGVAVVTAWNYHEIDFPAAVGFDNKQAARELAQHIIGLGHQRIAYISAPTDQNDRARLRLEGVFDAVKQAGLPSDSLQLVEAHYSIENGGAGFQTLMQSDNPPTVIMCGNDVLAVGALKRAKDMNYRVPDDVSITGFDDIELARVIDPALTTVHVPHREMGKKAAQMLAKMMRSEVVESVELQTTLQLRGTLAKPG